MTQTQSTSTAPDLARDAPLPYPFSIEQSFLRGQHESDGSSAGFGLRPISSGAWRVRGPIDRRRLQAALVAVADRHEALRVRITRTIHDWGQQVQDQVTIEPTYVDLATPDSDRDRAAEEFVARCEAEPFPDTSSTMLRIHVGELGPDDAVLVLIGFLPVVDVWSIGLVLRDVLTAYATHGQLPPAEPYRTYMAQPAPDRSEDLAWWRERLSGYRPFALTSDRPPAAAPSGTTRVDRFRLDAELNDLLTTTARHARATPYIVLLTIHLLQLAQLTGSPRGLVWMLTAGPGRRVERWEHVVGYFPNMCPLPVDLTGCTTFSAALARVRTGVLESFQHELPFVALAGGAADEIAQLEQPGLVVPGFAMFQGPADGQSHTTAGLTIEPLRRQMDQDAGPGIPDDAILWTITRTQDSLDYALSSSVDRFDRATMRQLADDFTVAAHQMLSGPDKPLASWSPPPSTDTPGHRHDT